MVKIQLIAIWRKMRQENRESAIKTVVVWRKKRQPAARRWHLDKGALERQGARKPGISGITRGNVLPPALPRPSSPSD